MRLAHLLKFIDLSKNPLFLRTVRNIDFLCTLILPNILKYRILCGRFIPAYDPYTPIDCELYSGSSSFMKQNDEIVNEQNINIGEIFFYEAK